MQRRRRNATWAVRRMRLSLPRRAPNASCAGCGTICAGAPRCPVNHARHASASEATERRGGGDVKTRPYPYSTVPVVQCRNSTSGWWCYQAYG